MIHAVSTLCNLHAQIHQSDYQRTVKLIAQSSDDSDDDYQSDADIEIDEDEENHSFNETDNEHSLIW